MYLSEDDVAKLNNISLNHNIRIKQFVEKYGALPQSNKQQGRPKGRTKRTIDRYKKVFHQFEILKKKYSSKTKAELYELLATKDYDGKTYSRKTIRNIIEDKKSGEYRLSHHIDLKTGFYKGRQVLDPKE